MAATSVYFISSIFVILVGLQSCWSLECTGDNLDKCESDHVDGDCPYYRKIVQCLESIDTCNEDGDLGSDLIWMLDRYRGYVNDCPGLPDGECYFNKMSFCKKQVPKGCDDESGFKKSKDCMAAIKPLCTAQNYIKHIDASVKRVEKAEAKCGL